ncbi:hypothetical protein QV07_09950 [Gallibacterium genomosp. 3]|uniref:Uncharacterized protein n=1 Tax=Gallibacterium genomosp. 3 TaxID=505345 RepID=A0A1A7PSK5_9PAST|nr:hypothetical protein QV07_09950 [Gallibacterium genomosp. 3]
MTIYHKNKKVFENTYSYKNSYSSHSIYFGKEQEQNYKKINIAKFPVFNVEYPYPNNYFKFRSR